MNITPIIDAYEAGLARQEAQRQAKLDKLREAKRQNAQAVEQCIKQVVAPFLENVKEQLAFKGYAADCELLMKKDSAVADAHHALGVKLTVSPEQKSRPAALASSLTYSGTFVEQRLTKEESVAVNNADRPPRTERQDLFLADLSPAVLEGHLRQFLSKVFTPPA